MFGIIRIIIFIDKILISFGFGTTIAQCGAIQIYNHLVWNNLGSVCYRCLNNSFQCLNNIICIFTHFFTYTYFQKIQTMLLEISYRMGLYIL